MRVRIELGVGSVLFVVLAACGGGVTAVTDGAVDGARADGTTGDGSAGDGSAGDGGGIDGGGIDGGGIDGGGIDLGDVDLGDVDLGGGTDLGTDTGPMIDAGCTMPASCYGGPAGTAGVGACRNGTQPCITGGLGMCTGEVDPSAESCNGVDDNCNGSTDEGLGMISCGIGACRVTTAACVAGRPAACTPGTPVAEVCTIPPALPVDENCNGAIDEVCNCVHVAPSGSDATGDGSSGNPVRTIQHGITIAGTLGLPMIVCVAAGASCPATAHYDEIVVMRNGVSVYGGYQQLGASWPRVASCVTDIRDQDARGVYFDGTVAMPTVLDGFQVDGHNDVVNAAITVQGSTGAIITNDVINGGAGTTSYGIDISNSGATGATPTISLDSITGGTGSTMSVGIHSLNSAPIIQNNCGALDAMGRCMGGCGAAGTRGIRARTSGTATNAYGIQLDASPNTLVDVDGICAFPGGGASPFTGDAAGVRITGDATGTIVRASNIIAGGATANAVGVWADPCAGAAPWIVNNLFISGNSPVLMARADGVRAVGDCHPRVDSNVRIVGGVESANNDANGVYCARDAATGMSSRCTVLNNALIQGSGGGFPPRSVGVRCDDGACARIANNTSITGQSGNLSYGIVLGVTGTFIDSNRIEAGCGRNEGDGILSQGSFARIQNNVIGGSSCSAAGAAPPAIAYAVHELLTATSNEVDLHSNTLLARGAAFGTCTSVALAIDVTTGAATPAGPLGIVRNNILHPGLCSTHRDIVEFSPAADPRIVENNDLWFVAAGDVLYSDEAATTLTSLAAVNGLTDITVAANLSVDPTIDATQHLMTASPCIDTGTMTGAPSNDLDGNARPQGSGFDIGADEH